MLGGLFLLYSIYEKQSKQNFILILALVIISTYSSNFAYYVFHSTALLFLVFLSYNYFRKAHETGITSTRMLAVSFSIISFSQVLFVFAGLSLWLYLVGLFVQLVGFIVLLIIFIKVVRNGKKKK
jgi:hypothetical protein